MGAEVGWEGITGKKKMREDVVEEKRMKSENKNLARSELVSRSVPVHI